MLLPYMFQPWGGGGRFFQNCFLVQWNCRATWRKLRTILAIIWAIKKKEAKTQNQKPKIKTTPIPSPPWLKVVFFRLCFFWSSTDLAQHSRTCFAPFCEPSWGPRTGTPAWNLDSGFYSRNFGSWVQPKMTFQYVLMFPEALLVSQALHARSSRCPACDPFCEG